MTTGSNINFFSFNRWIRRKRGNPYQCIFTQIERKTFFPLLIIFNLFPNTKRWITKINSELLLFFKFAPYSYNHELTQPRCAWLHPYPTNGSSIRQSLPVIVQSLCSQWWLDASLYQSTVSIIYIYSIKFDCTFRFFNGSSQ